MTVAERARLEVEVVKAVRVPIPPAFVRGVLRRAAAMPEVEARLPAGAASIAVRDHRNREFAGHDSVTDVLSFAGSNQHLGDLAISWATVVRQAAEFDEAEETELGLLCVHGLLHLLGWDHIVAPERREMNRLTHAALLLSGLTLKRGRID